MLSSIKLPKTLPSYAIQNFRVLLSPDCHEIESGEDWLDIGTRRMKLPITSHVGRSGNTRKLPHWLKLLDLNSGTIQMILVSSTCPDRPPQADSPGPVPDPSGPVIVDPADELGNVESAPEYGIDVTIHGGIIKYGPWADRQRCVNQSFFSSSPVMPCRQPLLLPFSSILSPERVFIQAIRGYTPTCSSMSI